MASRYEVEVFVSSATDLKNVNWRYGENRPYAVLWINPNAKCSTNVADGDTCPVWDQKLKIPLNTNLKDSVLCIDIIHAKNPDEDKTKPLIGSARIPLQEIIEEVGIDEKCVKSVKLKRPSGRPHGKLDVKVAVRDLRYRAPEPYLPPYEYATPRDYPVPVGYPYNINPTPYGQQPYFVQPGYEQQPYFGQPGYEQVGYGTGTYATAQGSKQSSSKFGVGSGLAVGTAVGLLGGLALEEGVDYVEDKIANDVADRVEDDLACDDGFDGGDF